MTVASAQLPPVVTVLIPARNEERDISGCLAAVATQDYPAHQLEVLVVDGASTDDTVAEVRAAVERLGLANVTIITNGAGTTPSNLNAGLVEARGEIVCRVDARTRIQPHHIRTCVETLQQRPEVHVVGGAQVALARDATAKARGIARALNNRITMGGARYRRRARSGPADTVYLGAFRTSELRRAGGWDEQLGTNQDFELNRRMGAAGIVWFHEALASGYLPRETFATLLKQYVRFGRAKVRFWRSFRQAPERRQVALLAAPLAGAAMLVPLPPRWWPLFVTGGLLGLDALGSSLRGADTRERLHGALGIAVVTGGWTLGVWLEVLAPLTSSLRRSEPSTPAASPSQAESA